ncbi:MAG: hypothetical protein HZB33_09715 [Nitrospirae bacterium]|nr:hypothetical protein [Nitrospirota bacterium]
MKTYTIKDNDGKPFAFEIDNVYFVSLRKLVKILSSLEGIRNIKARRLFERKENHIEFEYSGDNFVVWEPFGDNSRYWIGPKNTENKSDKITEIEEIFKNYKPPLPIKLFGDLISLNFKELFRS